jgi:mono/diheme cytochrome c family protein
MKWLRRIALGLGALLLLVLLVAGVLMLIGSSRFDRVYEVASHPLPAADDSSMSRGAYLAATRGCTECHGETLGGGVLVDDPMFARLYAPNLTRGRGGVGGSYTDADWERAIRHGIRRDGRTLFIMPSPEFSTLSDADVRALITYIAAQPPVDTAHPSRTIGPIPRLLVGIGAPLPLSARRIDHAAAHPALREERSVAYGAHVAQLCKGCHGANLEGATGGPAPAPPLDARGNLPRWTQEQFVSTLRTGVTPEGTQLDPAMMPWKPLGRMNDTELGALWMYLRTLHSEAARTSQSR